MPSKYYINRGSTIENERETIALLKGYCKTKTAIAGHVFRICSGVTLLDGKKSTRKSKTDVD